MVINNELMFNLHCIFLFNLHKIAPGLGIMYNDDRTVPEEGVCNNPDSSLQNVSLISLLSHEQLFTPVFRTSCVCYFALKPGQKQQQKYDIRLDCVCKLINKRMERLQWISGANENIKILTCFPCLLGGLQSCMQIVVVFAF